MDKESLHQHWSLCCNRCTTAFSKSRVQKFEENFNSHSFSNTSWTKTLKILYSTILMGSAKAELSRKQTEHHHKSMNMTEATVCQQGSAHGQSCREGEWRSRRTVCRWSLSLKETAEGWMATAEYWSMLWNIISLKASQRTMAISILTSLPFA